MLEPAFIEEDGGGRGFAPAAPEAGKQASERLQGSTMKPGVGADWKIRLVAAGACNFEMATVQLVEPGAVDKRRPVDRERRVTPQARLCRIVYHS